MAGSEGNVPVPPKLVATKRTNGFNKELFMVISHCVKN